MNSCRRTRPRGKPTARRHSPEEKAEGHRRSKTRSGKGKAGNGTADGAGDRTRFIVAPSPGASLPACRRLRSHCSTISGTR